MLVLVAAGPGVPWAEPACIGQVTALLRRKQVGWRWQQKVPRGNKVQQHRDPSCNDTDKNNSHVLNGFTLLRRFAEAAPSQHGGPFYVQKGRAVSQYYMGRVLRLCNDLCTSWGPGEQAYCHSRQPVHGQTSIPVTLVQAMSQWRRPSAPAMLTGGQEVATCCYPSPVRRRSGGHFLTTQLLVSLLFKGDVNCSSPKSTVFGRSRPEQ